MKSFNKIVEAGKPVENWKNLGGALINLTKKNQSHSPPKRGRLTTVKTTKPKSIFGGIIEVIAERDSPDSVSLTSRSAMNLKESGKTLPLA